MSTLRAGLRPRAVQARARLDLMKRIRSVAIVGMSADPNRPSHTVATYLLGSTQWDLYFVNPREDEILGRPVYPSLDALPIVPDLVDVFRRADSLPALTEQAIDAGAPAVWFQLGLRDDAAARRAVAAGLEVVQDRCLKIEHARFAGDLHTTDFDTGVIDTRQARSA